MDPVRLCISLGEAGSGSELALLASIILVTAGLGVVVATAVVVRHRSAAARHRSRVRARGAAPVTAGGYPVVGAVPTRRAPTGAGLEVAGDDLLACPTCLRRYAGEMRYCPHDARALVAAATVGGRRRGDGAPARSAGAATSRGFASAPTTAPSWSAPRPARSSRWSRPGSSPAPACSAGGASTWPRRSAPRTAASWWSSIDPRDPPAAARRAGCRLP